MSGNHISVRNITWKTVEGRYVAACVSELGECQIRFIRRTDTGINIVMYTYINPRLGDLRKYVKPNDRRSIEELVSILDERFEQVIRSEFVICRTVTGLNSYNIDCVDGKVYLFGYEIRTSDVVFDLSSSMKSNLLFQLINGMGI